MYKQVPMEIDGKYKCKYKYRDKIDGKYKCKYKYLDKIDGKYKYKSKYRNKIDGKYKYKSKYVLGLGLVLGLVLVPNLAEMYN